LGEGDAEAPELQGLTSRGIALGSRGETFGKKPNTDASLRIGESSGLGVGRREESG